MRFLAVHSVFYFHENFVLRFRLFKFYLFVYFIVYRDPLYYTHFTEKICPRHFRRWASLPCLHKKRKRLRILDILENIRKWSNLHRMIAQCPVSPRQYENSVNTTKKLLKYRNQTFPVMRYVTQKSELFSKHFFAF